jgi:hypothetical protein
MSEGTTAPTTKIVIVSGQEFTVSLETDNETIRESLKSAGFPDVANAQIQAGKKVVDGVEYQTIEFVKKAGTKGLDSALLAQLLAEVPAQRLPVDRLNRSAAALVRRLEEEDLTFGEALARRKELIGAVSDLTGRSVPLRNEGVQLCDSVDHIPAAPCVTPFGW